MKILIVDDHPVMRDGVEALLRRHDAALAVIQAGSAEEAMHLLDQHADLDAVVLDLKIHGTDGLAAISAIAGKRPKLLIIVLSSSENPSDVRAAFAQGALGYVPKSASAHTLLSAITMVLDGERYVPPLMLNETAALDAGHAAMPAPRIADAALTQRQVEVLRYIAEGAPNKLIADRLGLSEKTVKAHITAIFKALNVFNRTQAAAAGRKTGLI
ncbi:MULTISPECIES: response regulator transcription factor [unclassified Burkholderia]|uniref:response regulator n=1 Tax=unclassified Burkholderia TaxID=2613784 RepID=UPI00142006D0|nr:MULTISPECIES: response regulator transcription factor [unclassified Burkholderia]NIE82330.1 response regulator transcription factor [Burkholderia sp. Tr-860]NIF63022.1 response regulator transcription factor [Burkholderia sp. Cy-647]NIF95157.1 response regulator transcription factor [Burkholderia sp. Ax-1720]